MDPGWREQPGALRTCRGGEVRSSSGPPKGAGLVDADGNQYVDYVGSWGPLIVGHAHPKVVAAVQSAAANGTSYGIPTQAGSRRWPERWSAMVPSIDMVRMVNSGTEATMSAIRLARGYTGRKKLVKFDGCYHGHGDSLLVKAGSGLATLGIPGSPGVPEEIAQHTLSLPYNDLEAVRHVDGACWRGGGRDYRGAGGGKHGRGPARRPNFCRG